MKNKTPSANRSAASKRQKESIAVVKKASAGLGRLEDLLFGTLDKAKGVTKISLILHSFVDISGASPFPTPPKSRALNVTDICCKHGIRINGTKFNSKEKGGAFPTAAFLDKEHLPSLWRIRVMTAKGSKLSGNKYIPVGVACAPSSEIISTNRAEAVRVCTEASVFLYASDLFVLFRADFEKENVEKYTVLIQEAGTGRLGIIDPHNNTDY